MRNNIKELACVWLALAWLSPSSNVVAKDAAAPGTELVLLGTRGGPPNIDGRAGISSLLRVENHTYLIDAGDSVHLRMGEAGFKPEDLTALFLTHLHDDHTSGLPAVLSLAMDAGRSAVLPITGPQRTDALLKSGLDWLAINQEIRDAEKPKLANEPGEVFQAHIISPGVIYEDDAVRVTAIENTHFQTVAENPNANRNKSYSLKFETPDKTIVFTGDTGYFDDFAPFAKGADILVSEMAPQNTPANEPEWRRFHRLEEHLSPPQIAQIAAQAGITTVVLSHTRKVTEADLKTISSGFSGKVFYGHDLDRF